MTEQQVQFFAKVVPPALDSEREYGIPAAVTIAQAILESATPKLGWGSSSLFRLANNPFGIKYAQRQGAQDYGHFDVPTWEIENGQRVEVPAEFQRFPNLKAAFFAHAALLLRPRYMPAYKSRQDCREYAMAVMNCGYSTDRPELCKKPGCPHYAGKLIQLIEQYHLDDPTALAEYAAGAQGAA